MNHSYEVDFFALGVITYEIMLGVVSLFLLRDHTWEIVENKFVKKYWLIKQKFMKEIFLVDGIHIV